VARSYYGHKNRPGDFYWTENTIFAVSKGEAYQMEIRSYDGHDFLIIETGGFAPVIPKEGEAEPTVITPTTTAATTFMRESPRWNRKQTQARIQPPTAS
jgi:hypothetical protein